MPWYFEYSSAVITAACVVAVLAFLVFLVSTRARALLGDSIIAGFVTAELGASLVLMKLAWEWPTWLAASVWTVLVLVPAVVGVAMWLTRSGRGEVAVADFPYRMVTGRFAFRMTTVNVGVALACLGSLSIIGASTSATSLWWLGLPDDQAAIGGAVNAVLAPVLLAVHLKWGRRRPVGFVTGALAACAMLLSFVTVVIAGILYASMLRKHVPLDKGLGWQDDRFTSGTPVVFDHSEDDGG